MTSASMSALGEAIIAHAMKSLEQMRWLALLIARLSVGLLFVSTGWGKVHDLQKVTGFFEHLGIPAPAFNAILVGYSELICGTLLVVGLLSRLAAIPLVISMIVAILTAKLSDLHGLFDLVGFDEFTYLCVLVIIVILGPGAASLDAILVRRLNWPRAAVGVRALP
jgi:putative oxidoreductase